MSALDSLIRLQRWRVDERRRDLAALEELAAALTAERQRLDAEDAAEQRAAATSAEAGFAYPSYARSLVERRRRLEQSRAETGAQIASAREALAEAFQEMKRYETAAATRLRQQQEREARRERRVLDELGTEAFRRRPV